MKLNRVSFKNISSQVIGQGLVVILPLVSIPLIIKSMSIIEYGRLAIYQAVYLTLIAIVEYGFNLSGPKYLSEHTDKKKIVYQIIIAKIILFKVLTIGLFIYSIYNNMELEPLIIITLSVLLNCLNVNYYFQYMQAGDLILKIDGTAKIAGFLLILLGYQLEVITINYVLICQFLLFSLVNLIKLKYIKDDTYQFSLNVGDLKYAINLIREGWVLFTSKIATIGYSHSSLIYLSFFFPKESIAIFSIVDKVVKSAQNFMWPFIYDNNAKILKGVIKKKRALAYTSAISCIFVVLINSFAYQISVFLHLNDYVDFIPALRLYSLIIIVITAGTSISYFYNIPEGNHKNIRNSAWIALCSFLFIGYIFSNNENVYWMCLIVIFAELVSLIYKTGSLVCQKQNC